MSHSLQHTHAHGLVGWPHTHTHTHVWSVKRGWTRRGAEGWNGGLRRGRGEHDFLLESGVVCYFFAAQNGPFDVPRVYFDEAERFHYRSAMESVRFGAPVKADGLTSSFNVEHAVHRSRALSLARDFRAESLSPAN